MASIVLLKPSVEQIKSLLEKENAIIKRERKTVQARKLKEAGQRRIRAITYIKLIVEASFYGTDTAMQKAAAILDKDILFDYKDMLKTANIEEQTNRINRMIKAFADESHAPVIASLRLGAVLAELTLANENFVAVYARHKRLAESSVKAMDIRKVRAKLDVTFTKLADTIDMLYKVNAMGVQEPALHARLTTIINAINAMIQKSAIKLSARGQKFGKIPQLPTLS